MKKRRKKKLGVQPGASKHSLAEEEKGRDAGSQGTIKSG